MWSRILLIFSLAAALPAWAQTLAETLPNGMKVIVKEDARAPVAVAKPSDMLRTFAMMVS